VEVFDVQKFGLIPQFGDFHSESKMLVNELFCLIAQDTMIS